MVHQPQGHGGHCQSADRAFPVIECCHGEDGIEYRISSVDGFLEHMDVQQIVAWGARFPDAAGEAMFGSAA